MSVSFPQLGFVRKNLVFSLLIFFGYLLEVCAVPYLKIFGVSPNLLYVIIAVITVAYGKLRAFWAGMVFGLLMQVMLPSVSYLNLALYSLTALFCSFPFADKALKTIEYERATNRTRQELPPWMRTLLCAFMNILIYEAINVAYIYLGDEALTSDHIERAMLDILLTVLLTALLMFPLRRLIFGRRDAPVMRPSPVLFSRR